MISDDGPTRDEIDFEFLGGNKERPQILHTNIFTDGQGGREQQFYFWFDPTADFHDYTFLWNEKQLVYVIIISFFFSSSSVVARTLTFKCGEVEWGSNLSLYI